MTTLHLPMCIRKLAAALLDQQLWCFGRDIFHPDGNALLRYGMACHRVPEKHKGCHAYVHAPALSRRVVVWGFGVFYGDDALGGVFLKRYAFTPQHTSASQLPMPLWAIGQLPALTPPRDDGQIAATVALLSLLLKRLNEYEGWAAATLGSRWREACVRGTARRTCQPTRCGLHGLPCVNRCVRI